MNYCHIFLFQIKILLLKKNSWQRINSKKEKTTKERC